MEGRHDIWLGDFPTTLIEKASEAVRSWCLLGGHALDRFPNLIFGETSFQFPEIMRRHVGEIQVQRMGMGDRFSNEIYEMLMEGLFQSF